MCDNTATVYLLIQGGYIYSLIFYWKLTIYSRQVWSFLSIEKTSQMVCLNGSIRYIKHVLHRLQNPDMVSLLLYSSGHVMYTYSWQLWQIKMKGMPFVIYIYNNGSVVQSLAVTLKYSLVFTKYLKTASSWELSDHCFSIIHQSFQTHYSIIY